MKKQTWKKIISLLMCALLLFSVIDLSGNGFVRAEDSAYVKEEAADTSEGDTETPVDEILDDSAETPETENEISDEAPESENENSDEALETENGMDEISETENVSETEHGEDTDILSTFITEDGFDMDAFSDFLDSLSDEEYVVFMEKYEDVLSFLFDGYYEEVDTPTIYSNSGETITAHHSTFLNFNGLTSIQVSWFNMSDGRAALCATHSLNRPADGQQVADDASEDDPSVWKRNMSDELYRCFYFGWLKDKGSEIFTDSALDDTSHSVEMGYLAVSLIATEEMYGPSYSLNTGTSDLQGRMKAYANAHANEIPNAESIKFSKSNLTSSVVNNRFETEYVSFGNNDGTTQKVAITLPANISAVVKRTNGTEVTCNPNTNIEVAEGEQIKFTAPITASGNYSISATSTEEILSHQAWCYYFGDTYQRLLAKNVFTPTANLEFTFENLGCLELYKQFANPDAAAGCDSYSREGAEYGVYTKRTDAAAGNNNYTYKLVTDANGYAKLDDIPCQTYYIREIKESPGCFINTSVMTANVTSANTSTNRYKLTSLEQVKLDPIDILVTKQSDNGVVVPGAEYTVKYYKTSEAYRNSAQATDDPVTHGYSVDRQWVFRTDSKGLIRYETATLVSGDSFYYNSLGIRSLPYGTVTIQETKAPEGYTLDNTIYVRTIKPGDNSSVQASNVKVDITDEHQNRGDLQFTKTSSSGPVANVKFQIKNTDTGESHIVWTDANGFYSTKSSYIPHTKNTNSGNVGDGIWFGGKAVNDVEGALISGNYEVTELRCDANKEKYKYLAPITFTITNEGELKDLGDVYNEDLPKIHTTAKDPVTNSNVASYGDTLTLIDTVCMENLDAGHSYELTTKIWSKKHNDFLQDEHGNTYSDVSSFVAASGTETKDVSMTINVTDELLGEDIVFFEYLSDTAYPGEIIAKHEDVSCEEQTIHFPKLHTIAKDSVTYDHVGFAVENCEIIDTVSYENLVAGEEYLLKASLMVQETGDAVVDAAGNPVVVTDSFIPAASSGSKDVSITFDASLLRGQTVTVFEELFYNSKPVALEKEITNEEQSVHFPDMQTTAKDKATGTHEALAGPVTIVDTIDYQNLIAGEHLVKGYLVYTDTGEPVLIDGKKVEAEKRFTPDAPDGSVTLEYTFDASILAGRDVTVFEDLYYNDRKVCTHADVSSKEQTIKFPAISTVALDTVSLSHDAKRSHYSVIEDEISYSNVTVGEKYQIKGYLVDKDTKELFLDENGTPVTYTSDVFCPSQASGTIKAIFNVDSIDLLGKSLVVYEELYHVYANGEIVLIAQHKDADDKNQTVTYDSKVGTLTITIDDLPAHGGMPKTSDSTNLFLLFFLMATSGIGLLVAALYLRKNNKTKR